MRSRCSRSPQDQREWLAQYPYWAYPASSERRTVSVDRPHSTGVESTTHTSSAHRLVSRASTRISHAIVAAILRSRLLYPLWPGRQGNIPRRDLRAYRSQRDSLANPSSACITARVSSSASLSSGVMPVAGRQGARSGNSFSRSSVRT